MMNHRAVTALFCAALAGLSTSSANADFTYTETTQVTGGSLVSMMKTLGMFSKSARQFGQPVESTVIVRGNRMTRINADHTEIIDLDKDTITQIDNVKHQYTVMTFEQLKQRIQEAAARARTQQAQQTKQQPVPSDVQLKFTVKVRNTNATKDVAGLSAKEAIMVMTAEATQAQTPDQTGTLGFTSDLWLAPEIPGYKEVRDFYARMAEKMGSVFSAGAGGDMSAMSAQLPPGAMQGIADMAKEMEKIKGVPVQTVIRMGMTVNGAPIPAASEAPLPASDGPAMPSKSDMAKAAVANSLPFHGFGMGKKKSADPPPAAADANQPVGPVVMMETTTQLSSFSSDPVNVSKFEVPAGYKQIEVKDVR